MSIRRFLLKTVIFKLAPRGVSPAVDILRQFRSFKANVIFDVGANTGQSAISYARWYPESCIYSFEPVSTTFTKLKENVSKRKQIKCFQFALGESNQEVLMASNGTSPSNAVLSDEEVSQVESSERVDVKTLDDFCTSNNIQHIDYLKIDTEGSDYNVLLGAEKFIDQQAIDFIEVEAGMYPGNTRHVPLEKFKSFFESKGYLVYSFYEQVPEWVQNKPNLRRANVLFISNTMIERYV